jgi:hypothetical protein
MSDKAGHTKEQAMYRSYLLRLWRVREGEEDWRASLESARTGERRGFANLDALFAYVRGLTRSDPDRDSGTEGNEVERQERRG